MIATDSIRNLGIIAHIDAGKTTLSERILFYSNKIHRMGEVHDGAATMDYLPEEQERGITINSACTSCTWQDHMLNLIDTPGHVDFSIEVERCLRVLDGAVGVFCAVGGVEPQSETVWSQSERFGIPKIVFINKVDRQGADFIGTIESINSRLGANAVAVNIPQGVGETFSGVYDLISLELLQFDHADQGVTIHRRALAEDEIGLISPWREKLLEKLAESDDTFLELWIEQRFTTGDIFQAIRRATLARKLTPVLCGAALRNIGVQPLLDAICKYLPSPTDITTGKFCSADFAEHLVALVFKVVMENGRKTAFLRIYSGVIQEGGRIFNVNQQQMERVGHLFRLHADRREQIDRAGTGEIIALTGLKHAHTGATYAEAGQETLLESIEVTEPVMTLVLEVRNADEVAKLDEALERYTAEDPTLQIQLDNETGSRKLRGMGELHLAVVLDRLQREYGIRPRTGPPEVVLRETTSCEGIGDFIFDRELGKEHHRARVALTVSPQPRGTGNTIFFTDSCSALPQQLHDATVEGIHDALQSGVLTAWPVIDVSIGVTLVASVDEAITAPGCYMAAQAALRDALAKAEPKILEPLMRTEITVPESFLGPSIALLTACKGKVDNLSDVTGGQKQISALAPLRQLFGFSTSLRSATQGRAGFSLVFEKFDAVS